MSSKNSTQFMITTDLNPNDFHYSNVIVDKSRKSVKTFASRHNLTYENRIMFQLCKDENHAMPVKYDIEPRDGDDPQRRNVIVTITDPDMIEKLQEIDAHNLAVACERSKEWFKKEISAAELKIRYKPILNFNEERNEYVFKFKLVLPSVDDPKRQFTEIFTTDGSKPRGADHTIVTRDAMVVPVVHTNGIWFMGGDSSFGMSFVASIVRVQPKEVVPPMKKMRFSTPLDIGEGAVSGVSSAMEADDEIVPEHESPDSRSYVPLQTSTEHTGDM